MRARTVSSFGQSFGPFLVSDAAAGVVPPSPPETVRGSRWHQKRKGRPMPKWFFFRDEIEQMDEETLIELDIL
jgi:hypothetical protein